MKYIEPKLDIYRFCTAILTSSSGNVTNYMNERVQAASPTLDHVIVTQTEKLAPLLSFSE
ncbi:MAG: hypothetical protein IJH37_01265 [Clostridia bacterium]|nr:hypothetical protein [Clostridia bacterium]